MKTKFLWISFLLLKTSFLMAGENDFLKKQEIIEILKKYSSKSSSNENVTKLPILKSISPEKEKNIKALLSLKKAIKSKIEEINLNFYFTRGEYTVTSLGKDVEVSISKSLLDSAIYMQNKKNIKLKKFQKMLLHLEGMTSEDSMTARNIQNKFYNNNNLMPNPQQMQQRNNNDNIIIRIGSTYHQYEIFYVDGMLYFKRNG